MRNRGLALVYQDTQVLAIPSKRQLALVYPDTPMLASPLIRHICKVEFNQPSCWLYSVPNLLVIQHLETLYLGGNHVREVCEKV